MTATDAELARIAGLIRKTSNPSELTDLTLFVAAADLTEEAGDELLARGCRACWRLQKRPCQWSNGRWDWLKGSLGDRVAGDAFLPEEVWVRLRKPHGESWESAVRALGEAIGDA